MKMLITEGTGTKFVGSIVISEEQLSTVVELQDFDG
jgi:hypothetical protein